ncbi:sigma 54-interacting transcriptional regulator [uncultured Cocleimonas sp.]|uniref:sigma-54-dependent Fis family transcriptional regulator n=1 Tax=uncultured Cocleimonas sp. TaxID=1051587 RepID=UPI0026269943|nr:sigma 54-interacting transcriptional regulator [uncultured Cocleimonas sp.]
MIQKTPNTSTESELLVISQAAKLITDASNPRPAIEGILRLLSELLGLNRGRVVLPSENSEHLSITYSYGLTEDERTKGNYVIGEGITGRVFKSAQIALIQDIDDEPIYLTRAVDRINLPEEAVAFLAVPIILDELPIGVLATHRLRNRNRPFQRDLTLLQIIATLIGQVLQVKSLIEERTANLLSENKLLRNQLESKAAKYGIIGESQALQQVVQQALQVSKTNATVLLLGESGTGKERFARLQHLASDRADGPFIGINCAAIPATLIESELFGHEKGAFTGATSMKKGKIEMANGGTLFLDEIGDLELDLQVKLLKVLETRSIQRVGSSKDFPIDVRILAATHQNLQEAVNEQRFRLDLFYRLNVFPIRLPPLRARHGDVPLLAQHFLIAANEEYGKQLNFSISALDLLENYSWPGNIRQLENLTKRAVLLSTKNTIDGGLIKKILQEEQGIVSPASDKRIKVDSYEHMNNLSSNNSTEMSALRPYSRIRKDEIGEIQDALRHNRGNKTRAAISLGLTPRQLRYRMQKLKISSNL